MTDSCDSSTLRPWAQRQACCPTFEPCIEVRDLTVAYDGKTALHRVSLDISRGCITAIVGPSGCGKSSFLSTLNRLSDLTPTCQVSGCVRIEGQEIVGQELNLISLRRQVGMIFQKPNPFPLSIHENLAFPLRHHGMNDRQSREEEIEKVLSRVGLWEEVKDRLHAPALGLSGGQQQRLCLARALVLSPRILLLDEPCSALDPLASAVVEDLIASLRGDYTVVIVTHNLAQAKRIADYVAMFWQVDGAGTVIEHGSAGTLFDSPADPITAAYIAGARG
ncbi:MAG: phosphate ABC transporter ATP-binding protein [Pseudohongiellaceae bacterium]